MFMKVSNSILTHKTVLSLLDMAMIWVDKDCLGSYLMIVNGFPGPTNNEVSRLGSIATYETLSGIGSLHSQNLPAAKITMTLGGGDSGIRRGRKRG